MLANTSTHPYNLDLASAEGSYLYDLNGNKYLDFIAGIGVNNLGHNLSSVTAAVNDQMNLHSHAMVYGEFNQSSPNRFAKNLLSFFPESLDMVYPVNSGTEANEAAIKIAKRYTGRSEIVSFKGAYHGNTAGSMSISYNESKKSAYRPLIPGTRFIELNNSAQLGTISSQTAAVILETIQGDAGVRIPTMEYLKALRNKCSETGTLLILDEIQCGYGRTGKFNAFENFEIVPDMVTLGKALGCGLPIGAVVGNREVLSCIQNNPELGHITTFGGNPVVCAAADEGLNLFRRLVDSQEVEEKGKRIDKLLNAIPAIKEIRRMGLMIAVELESPEKVEHCILEAKKRGVILFWFLSTPNSFRISPPLTISNDEIDEGCSIISSILSEE
ncbi:MAG: aspartate aminotransferase family protein [Crocinitomicaceae bacterium]|nr:aspartate aminotransferase family protein [Crocinitomicaceae bacterium]|tara:strand:+ start:6582 stop:7739 length:1158 start_codon:yes stop_codon:yes gene_type:complete